MSLNSDMTPRLALLDHRDLSTSDSELLCDAALDHASGEQSADFKNLIFRKCGVAMFRAAPPSRKTISDGMQLVRAGCRPFKICGAVVRFVAIKVVNLIIAIWLGTKRTCHQSMNGMPAHRAAQRHGGTKVSSVAKTQFQYLASHTAFGGPTSGGHSHKLPREGTYAACIRNLMARFIVGYRSPNLAHVGGSKCL